ncbi:hypothetical protein BH23ACT2_BH23ACT2_05260 [soil metagenome]
MVVGMDAGAVADRYLLATEETRRLVDRLLQHDIDDRVWTDQLGPAYRQSSVADLLAKSKQAVSRDHRLLRLTMRSGAVGYPALQFDGRRVLPGIAEVVERLAPVVATNWTIASWLTSAQPSLGDATPIDLLRARRVEPVVAAAGRFAEALAT